MSWENIKLEKEGKVGVIIIDRPKALNALDPKTFNELDEALNQCIQDAQIGAVIITGGGDKAFVAGSDIKNLLTLDVKGGRHESLRGQQVFNLIATMNKPVIAAVNGYALGGGCELALACDLRIASENAKFGQPEIKLAVTPGYAGTQRLPRIVGRGNAFKMLFTGDMIDAQEAYRIGLVQEVVSADQLRKHVLELAQKLADSAPLAIAAIKRCVRLGMEVSLDEGSRIEAEEFGLLFGTQDLREGMTAFIEKRPPKFKGK